MTPPLVPPSAPPGRADAISPSPISASRRRHDLAAAFLYAFDGLATGWRTQRNLRIHAGLAILAAALAVWLRLPPLAAAMVAGAIAAVLTAELFNSAIEAVVDLVSPDVQPLAKQAKDLAAAAVLVAAAGAVAIGALVAVDALPGR